MTSKKAHLVAVHDIHALGKEDTDSPLTLKDLSYLLAAEAAFYTVRYEGGDLKRLSKLLQESNNTIRGFIISWDHVPAAFAIYSPMISPKGRGASVENLFITESFRNHGLGKLLSHELASRAINDGADYLEWSTDKRNEPVHGYARSVLKGRRASVLNIDANKLLDPDMPSRLAAKNGWSEANLTTRCIKPNDGPMLEKLGLSPLLIRHSGDLPFIGFITFEKGQLQEPLAVTLGWRHNHTKKIRSSH